MGSGALAGLRGSVPTDLAEKEPRNFAGVRAGLAAGRRSGERPELTGYAPERYSKTTV
jgi:hypothetical protein